MGLLLSCFNGKKNRVFITKKLILGCGTLVTTKLIMDYLNISKVVKINHHPRLFSVYFSRLTNKLYLLFFYVNKKYENYLYRKNIKIIYNN